METNKIILGDCIEKMRDLPDGSIKIAITSPPYNVNPDKTNARQGLWKNSLLMRGGYDGHDDALEYGQYVEWQRATIAAILRLLQDDGVLFYNHKWVNMGGVFYDRNEIVSGFPVRCIVIWDRSSSPFMTKSAFTPTYEVIYVIAKPDFRLLRKGISSVWRFNHACNNPHPAPYPVELPARCLDACVARNDPDAIVLDPFMGSGTTAIAAERHGIKWVGIEKSMEYTRMARERIQREKMQGKLAL